MKILFLDDSEERIYAFVQKAAFGDTVYIARTAAECIEKLQEREYDIISLDHDLGGEVFVNSNRADCGMEVVRWMDKNLPSRGAKVIIHSWNIPAANAMSHWLIDAGYSVRCEPFSA
jgi:CheY-like chemotaxis protein